MSFQYEMHNHSQGSAQHPSTVHSRTNDHSDLAYHHEDDHNHQWHSNDVDHNHDGSEYWTDDSNLGNPSTHISRHMTQVDRRGKLFKFDDKNDGAVVYAAGDKQFIWDDLDATAILVSYDEDGHRIAHYDHEFNLYEEDCDMYFLLCALRTLPTTSLVDAVPLGHHHTLWVFESDTSHPIYGVWEQHHFTLYFEWDRSTKRASEIRLEDDGKTITRNHSYDLAQAHTEAYVLLCAHEYFKQNHMGIVGVDSHGILWRFQNRHGLQTCYGLRLSDHKKDDFDVYFEWNWHSNVANQITFEMDEHGQFSPIRDKNVFDLYHFDQTSFCILAADSYFREDQHLPITANAVDRNDLLWEFKTSDSRVCYGRWNPAHHHFDSFIEVTPRVFQATSFGMKKAILKTTGQKMVQQNPLKPTQFYEMAKSKHWKTYELDLSDDHGVERKPTVVDLKTFHVISMEKNLRQKLMNTQKMVLFGHTPKDADSQELLVAVASVLDRKALWCEQNASEISSNMCVNVATSEQAQRGHHHSVALPKMISTDANDQDEAWRDILENVFNQLKLADNKILVKDLIVQLQAETQFQQQRTKRLEKSKKLFHEAYEEISKASDAFKLESGLAWKLKNFGSEIYFVGGKLELIRDTWEASIGSAVMVHDFKLHLIQLLCALGGGKDIDKDIMTKLTSNQHLTDEALVAELTRLDENEKITLASTMKRHLAEGLTYGFPTIDEIAHLHGNSETLGVVDPIRLVDVLEIPTKTLRKEQDPVSGSHFFQMGGAWHHHETFDFIRKYDAVGVLSREAYDKLFDTYFDTIPEDLSMPSSKQKALRKHFDDAMAAKYELNYFNRLYEHTPNADDWIIVTMECKHQ